MYCLLVFQASSGSVWQQLQELCASNPAGKAALDRHAQEELQSSPQAEAGDCADAAPPAAQAAREAVPLAAAAAAAAAGTTAAAAAAGKSPPFVEELPGGIIRVVMKVRGNNRRHLKE
jgi:hypothetical protein